jgi:hypothetical protein
VEKGSERGLKSTYRSTFMTKRYSKRENMAGLGQTREVYMIIDIKKMR